jgi:hypothetical protein
VYKKANFLFFCMIFVATQIFSQKLQQQNGIFTLLQTPVKPVPVSFLLNKNIVTAAKPMPLLSCNYYATQLGFFCKQEMKFEKVVKIPFKFRMGSVEDCDRLEGKRRNH